jgi:hypothetical protein
MAHRPRLTPLIVAIAASLVCPFPALSDPIAMGPQAMEGNLKVSPGTVLMAGFDFTIPGSHPEEMVLFVNPMVVFQAQCPSGADAGTIMVGLVSELITVPQNSSAWYPSGDQHSPLVYQGSTIVPDLCQGGLVSLRKGGTFSADVLSTVTTSAIHVRWHYSANGTSGSWSGTRSVLPSQLGG